jgi:hypothetical protein
MRYDAYYCRWYTSSLRVLPRYRTRHIPWDTTPMSDSSENFSTLLAISDLPRFRDATLNLFLSPVRHHSHHESQRRQQRSLADSPRRARHPPLVFTTAFFGLKYIRVGGVPVAHLPRAPRGQ